MKNVHNSPNDVKRYTTRKREEKRRTKKEKNMQKTCEKTVIDRVTEIKSDEAPYFQP